MKRTVHAFVSRGENRFVATCHEIHVVTQGQTLDEAVDNLREAVDLFFEDEDLSELGFAENPVLLVSFEVEPLRHAG